MPAPKPPARKKLPPALAKRVERELAEKRARVAQQARADIDLIARRRRRITEDFFDVGEALVRLRAPAVAGALGYPSFDALCQAELDMTAQKANHLIAIVTRVRRQDAVRMGQERAAALIALADATPEDDAPRALERATLALPSGRRLHVADASVREILGAAKEIRAARANGKRTRGRTTTAAERSLAARLEAALHRAGIASARVKAIATKPGQPAHARIDGVPLGDLGVLRRALPAG